MREQPCCYTWNRSLSRQRFARDSREPLNRLGASGSSLILNLSKKASLSEYQAVRYVVVRSAKALKESLFCLSSIAFLARVRNMAESSTLTVSIFDHEPTVVLFVLRFPGRSARSLRSPAPPKPNSKPPTTRSIANSGYQLGRSIRPSISGALRTNSTFRRLSRRRRVSS